MQRAIEDARREAAHASDVSYAELMHTYVELGEAVMGGRLNECDDLVSRLIRVGKIVERDAEQRWVAWVARQQR